MRWIKRIYDIVQEHKKMITTLKAIAAGSDKYLLSKCLTIEAAKDLIKSRENDTMLEFFSPDGGHFVVRTIPSDNYKPTRRSLFDGE